LFRGHNFEFSEFKFQSKQEFEYEAALSTKIFTFSGKRPWNSPLRASVFFLSSEALLQSPGLKAIYFLDLRLASPALCLNSEV
jgi:hypothetical protein